MNIGKFDTKVATTTSIYDAVLGDTGPTTPEVSTAELRRIVADGSAIIVDTRKPTEFAAGHIPGAINIPSIAEDTTDQAVAPVARLTGGDKTKALVLYCNGPFCKGTRRLSEQLADSDFTNVRRYQLGIPIWRALGGPTVVELSGILRIYGIDSTALFFDARNADAFAARHIPNTHSVPIERVAKEGIQIAPLPRDDFITRITVFGDNGLQARALAEALGKSPFHNVTYFPGIFEELATALGANNP